jgi:hypothetical protein
LLQSGTPTDYNLQIVNSTFGQNTAENNGGGASINNGAKVLILNSTFSENDAAAGHGGGLYIPNTVGGRTLVQNTLIAANTGSNASTADVYAWKASGSDMAPVLDASSTHNLIGVTSTTIGLPSTGNLSGTSTTPLDAKLLALENNGGWTPTYALGDGSPAVDAGSDDFANGYWFDQRLKPRLTDGNLDAIEMVDIGAYEADADEFFAHLGI